MQYIEPSPHRKGSAYYAVYRYLLGDYQPYIYKTDDYGKTWTRLTDGKNGIPADWPTRVVREDPDREGLLYAGTEFGMFISFDNGAHWQPFQLNLPNVPVTDIKVHHKDLVVSTQGRALWILDDVTSLHQLTPQMASSQTLLFKPRDGYRTRVGPTTLGPTIEYYLPAVPDGPVKLDILDASGALVNSYSSDTPPPAAGRGRGGRGGAPAGAGANAAAGGQAAAPDDPDASGGGGGRGRGGAPPPRVTKNAGMNRAVWNVQHQSTLTAPPGAYQARLTVGTTTLTQPFTVLIDPRIAAEGVTAADLKEQFDHNLRMRALVADASETVARVRDAQTKLRGTTGADAEKARRVDTIADALLTPQQPRYSKPGLQSHITYLAGMTTGVDQKVGRDALDRYQVLRKQLDAIRAELDKILGPAR